MLSHAFTKIKRERTDKMNIIYADVDRCGGFSGIMVKKS